MSCTKVDWVEMNSTLQKMPVNSSRSAAEARNTVLRLVWRKVQPRGDQSYGCPNIDLIMNLAIGGCDDTDPALLRVHCTR